MHSTAPFRIFVCSGLVAAFLAGCGGAETDGTGEEGEMGEARPEETPVPDILASNAFYYYADLDGAWEFYARILGFETVADYGFAKILRVGPHSFLTLVDEALGMHSSREPKSVTLAVVTEEVEGWWTYLSGEGVEMRAELGEVDPGRPHNGFVAVDPEGYLLEFERFNPHPENERLIPVLAGFDALYPDGSETAPGIRTTRPAELGVQATVLWLYYDDLESIQAFYRDILGVDILVDQGWAKVVPAAPTGFLGFVDGARGLHQATEDKAVTVSFLTSDLEAWWRHLKSVPSFIFRSGEVTSEGGFVDTFVGYDPEGYYLEWDEFLPVEVNRELLEALESAGPSPSGTG